MLQSTELTQERKERALGASDAERRKH